MISFVLLGQNENYNNILKPFNILKGFYFFEEENKKSHPIGCDFLCDYCAESASITETTFFTTISPLKCFLRLEENFTFPAFRAKRVWSRPTPTFLPAMIFVPRCRTIIEPTFADCPSASLVPKYFGFESRRFFAEPPAFLCAIVLNVIHGMDHVYCNY